MLHLSSLAKEGENCKKKFTFYSKLESDALVRVQTETIVPSKSSPLFPFFIDFFRQSV